MIHISYIVTIDYKTFTFSNVEDAMLFAERALIAQDETYSIKIEFKIKGEE